MAAYGRAALHWEADYWQTAEGQDALQHGIAIFCNPRPVQFRSVAGLDSRRWWRDGSVLSPARGHGRTACYEPNLLDSRCGNRAMRAAGAVSVCTVDQECPASRAWQQRYRRVLGHGLPRLLRLCCCQARGSPGQGLWRGEGICSVFRMNPVLADHLRAHSAEVRGGRVCRG